MICNHLSFDSCQCDLLTMGSMWWGVSKGSISSLSPFCAGFHRMPAFWCTWKSADTSRDYFGPSLLLFLFAALDGPHWKKGKDWQLFDCIWCLRPYTELPSTCLPVQSPQLFLLWLLLPHPSGVCVTGMRFGSSVIVTQETWKDSGHWGPLLDRTWTDVLLVPWKPFPGVRQLHRSVLASDLKFPFYTPGVHCNFLSSVLP